MFATYVANGTSFWGVVADGGMIAMSPDFPQWPTLRNVIEADSLDDIAPRRPAAPSRILTAVSTMRFRCPTPEKIICVGVNFPDRNAEYKDGQEAPPNMSLFIRFPALLRRPRDAAHPPAGNFRNSTMKARSPS
jgi:2-keto-4-pentenoate hydratase/2-oxohepta-3-ene-1,7-dioic acid hydratase in catechol pathway